MSSTPSQIPLDLGHRTALGREDFLVAPANQDAVAWIDRWPDWPAPALVVHGPPACGKSHLAEVWREASGALLIGPGEAAPAGAHQCLIEDADRRDDDAALFHLYNRLAAGGGAMLVTCREPPGRWRDRLPDLVSRLRAAPAVAIAAPDDALFAAVLVKLFSDRQLRVGADAVPYLVTHMERSFDAASRLVAEADRTAMAHRRGLTLPLLREVLTRL